MDTGGPLHVRGHHVFQRHFDRLVMLSDGVFAIAMTLSAVELRPETPPGASLAQVWTAPLLTYFLSFFIIGGVWIHHRRALAHLRAVDLPLTLLTLLLLSLVALTPVVIRVMLSGDFAGTPQGMLLYALSLAAIYACLGVSWGYAAFVADLAPDVPRTRAWSWLMQEGFVTALFGALALYSLHMKIPAVLMTLIAVVGRVFSARLENAAKREEQAIAQESADPRQ